MLWRLWQSRAPPTILVTFSTHANSDVRFVECLTLMLEHTVIFPQISWALWSQRPDLPIKRTNSESINSRRVPQTEVPISRHLAIEHFQIDNISRSWAAGDFRHPAGGEVPAMDPPGFNRLQIRAFQKQIWFHWNFYEKIFKNKKVRAFSQS